MHSWPKSVNAKLATFRLRNSISLEFPSESRSATLSELLITLQLFPGMLGTVQLDAV